MQKMKMLLESEQFFLENCMAGRELPPRKIEENLRYSTETGPSAQVVAQVASGKINTAIWVQNFQVKFSPQIMLERDLVLLRRTLR